MEIENHITRSEEETIELGTDFARRLDPGDVVALYGGLGSGKTEFVKGICNYFNVQEIVTSPTFTIMNQYFGQKDDEDIAIYHIDLYRIKTAKELEEIGFDDCMFSQNAIKLVEWAEKADGMLPPSLYTVKIFFNEDNENERRFQIERIDKA